MRGPVILASFKGLVMVISVSHVEGDGGRYGPGPAWAPLGFPWFGFGLAAF